MKTPFTGRSTGEVLVLLVAFTVCGYVVMVGTAVLIFEFVHPEVDASPAFRSVANIINTLIGLLAGFLAGSMRTIKKDDEDQS